MTRCRAVVTLALVALTMPAGRLGAQTVRGRLVHAGQGAAPPALLVQLIDSDDRVVARALSGSDSRFQLRAPRAGTYRVRALRIGFRPSISGSVTLADGEERDLEVELASTAVVLNPVNIAERRVCEVNPDTASQTAAAWGEVLKALALSEVTRATRQYHMRIALYVRHMDRRGRLMGQTQSEREGSTVTPFKATPADSLARYGYVEMQDASITYHGPDAQVLLSDAFARTHCLRLVPRESGSSADTGWIGIAFEPIQDDRPDIEGVLWLDRQSNELREVEYAYVALHPVLEAARPGGRVAFQQLPLGGWIVSRWWIRMPVPRVVEDGGASGRPPRVDVTSLQETGGEVLTVNAGAERVWTGRTSGIRGEVFMESAASPAGVAVRLENTNRRAVTDSTGRFAFDVLLPGDYVVVAEVAELRALGQSAIRLPLAVRDSAITPVTIQIPSRSTVITRTCGDGAVSDSLGLLRVFVTDSATRAPAADARVVGRWHRSLVRQGEFVAATNTQRIGEQIVPGVFWLCAAPKDRFLELRITRGSRRITTDTRIPFDSVFADHRVVIGAP